MSNVRCPHDWGAHASFWRCSVCGVITSSPDSLSPPDFPDDLCGEQMMFATCRKPRGHDGWHFTGDLGEASYAWDATA